MPSSVNRTRSLPPRQRTEIIEESSPRFVFTKSETISLAVVLMGAVGDK